MVRKDEEGSSLIDFCSFSFGRLTGRTPYLFYAVRPSSKGLSSTVDVVISVVLTSHQWWVLDPCGPLFVKIMS